MNENPTIEMPSNISKFRFWCQKVLPTVYDDSLSYMELLCKVVAKLNEVIENTNTQSDAINELAKLFGESQEHINQILDEINQNIENFKTEILQKQTDFETTITNQQTEFENSINTKQTDFETTITNKQSEFENSINTKQTNFETTINEQITSVEQDFIRLQNYVNDYFENLNIQNEVNAKIDELKASGALTALITEALNPIDKYLILTDRFCLNETDVENGKNWVEHFAQMNNLTLRQNNSADKYADYDIPIADIEPNACFGLVTNNTPRFTT